MQLIADASDEKLRGGFYTPPEIAGFILKWATNGNKDYDILEPSCGDGIFLKQIKKMKFKYTSITAIEIDKEEAEKTNKIKLKKKQVIATDFYKYCNSTEKRFDLVVGNPPYIRYQYFDKEQRNKAETIFIKAGLKYSKLANAWVSFVVGATLLLKKEGKIAFVLPAELLQVSYAKQLRNYLAHTFNKINIISFKKLVFPKIQQEVVLLLCERNSENDSHLIEHLELNDASKLKTLDVTKLKSPKKKIDFHSNKWTFYFLSQKEIDFIERVLHQKEIKPIRHYANVKVGITTGANKFFTVPKETVERYNLQEYAHKMVGRSVQVVGSIFKDSDWKENVEAGVRAFFLLFPPMKKLKKNSRTVEYIKEGEKDKIEQLYKCRIRDEWQIVPSAWISELLYIRRNNIFPKMIINETGAYTTDTMHRVTIKKEAKLLGMELNIKAFVASYYNSLSFALAEICGRSHGGGALELMPSEVENILLPYQEKNAELIETIDSMLRAKKSIDEILKLTDKKILKEGYGFHDDDIKLANSIWKKLLKRRKGRNGRKNLK